MTHAVYGVSSQIQKVFKSSFNSLLQVVLIQYLLLYTIIRNGVDNNPKVQGIKPFTLIISLHFSVCKSFTVRWRLIWSRSLFNVNLNPPTKEKRKSFEGDVGNALEAVIYTEPMYVLQN